MKYYHLIRLSVGLTVLQFIIQKVFHFETPLGLRGTFFGIQSVLLVGYAILMVVFFKKKKQKKLAKKEKVVPLDQEKKHSYLKAS